MRKLKSLLVFLIFFFAVFFLSEWFLARFFQDEWVLWKTLSISLISAIGFIYPHYRKGLKPADILKYSYTCVEDQKISLEELHAAIEKAFPKQEFKLRTKANNSIYIQRKLNRQSFGEVIRLKKEADKFCLFSRPAYWLDLFDNGECYYSRQKILAILK